MKAAKTKVRITAGARRSAVPMEPPTATMVICPAVSWRRRPDSGFDEAGFDDGEGIRARIRISEVGVWRWGKGSGRSRAALGWTAGGDCPTQDLERRDGAMSSGELRERADRMTFVIALWGKRVAGAGGGS